MDNNGLMYRENRLGRRFFLRIICVCQKKAVLLHPKGYKMSNNAYNYTRTGVFVEL